MTVEMMRKSSCIYISPIKGQSQTILRLSFPPSVSVDRSPHRSRLPLEILLVSSHTKGFYVSCLFMLRLQPSFPFLQPFGSAELSLIYTFVFFFSEEGDGGDGNADSLLCSFTMKKLQQSSRRINYFIHRLLNSLFTSCVETLGATEFIQFNYNPSSSYIANHTVYCVFIFCFGLMSPY